MNFTRPTKTARALAVPVISLLLMLAVVSASLVMIASASAEDEQVKVWVNTNSGIYWCPGSQWYGKTKKGKFMGECDAIKEGYRPAYNRPCGSKCKMSLSAGQPFRVAIECWNKWGL